MPTRVNPAMTDNLLRTDITTQTLSADTVVKNGGLNGICPIGSIVLWCGAPTLGIPTGWMPCDGSILTIASFPDLFAVIEDSYGGDGVIDYALPNITGAVPTGLTNGDWIIRVYNPPK